VPQNERGLQPLRAIFQGSHPDSGLFPQPLQARAFAAIPELQSNTTVVLAAPLVLAEN
jgi:hypothetical protein